jgi:hypothetical protein
MIAWFHGEYEDPVHRLPYNSREGGYQWVNGGPYTADDAIQGEFSNLAAFETMQDAVTRIEEDGFDWSPRPDNEPDDGVYSINDPLPDFSEFQPDDEAYSDVETLRQEMHTRLDQLEELVRSRMPTHGGMGHNQPPELLDELPAEVDLDELLEAIVDARREGNATTPDLRKSEQVARQFRQWAGAIGRWTAERANAQVDNVVTGLTAGTTILWAHDIVAGLMAAAKAVGDWISPLLNRVVKRCQIFVFRARS